MTHPEPEPCSPEALLGNLRHELRTPINAIIGYSELWLEEMDDAACASDLGQVRAAGQQLLAAVNAVLRPALAQPGAAVDSVQLGRALRAAMQAPLAVVDTCCRRLAGGGHGFSDDMRRILHAGQQFAALVDAMANQAPAVKTLGLVGDSSAGEHPDSAGPAPVLFGAESILVVDDNPDNSALLAGRLERMGYATTTAGSGESALRLIASRRFDLILLDVMMPGISGIDVLKQVRQTHSVTDLPVIMVTARDESDEIVTALEAGANDYVTKPVSLAVLSARARTQLLLKQMVAALEAANAKLSDLSFRDGLTQIANRRRFDEYLENEWLRGARSAAPLSVLLVDIDFFKPYNDTYGHEAGDAALKRVAGALSAAVTRPADLVTRYGGEEFVAILPETDGPGAVLVAERMREKVRALAIPHIGSQAAPWLTVSVGVGTCVPDRAAAASTLVQSADLRLYQAKRAGRDRVCAAG